MGCIDGVLLAVVNALRLKFGRFGADDKVPVFKLETEATVLGRVGTGGLFVGLGAFSGIVAAVLDPDEIGRSIVDSGLSTGLLTAFL